MEVAPAAATVAAGGTVQFTAVEYDPAGNRIAYPLAPGWSVVEGPGTIDEAGRYTAPAGATGTATVQASMLQPGYRGMNYDYVGGRATVEIVPAGPVITGVSAAYASGDVVNSANTVVLRAAATDAGETGG